VYGLPGPSSSAALLAVDEDAIAAWVHILEDGSVSVFTGKVEVGQNIRTSLAQAVAEELAVPVQSITMVMGDTLLTPFDAGTYGSRTTPYKAPQLRKAAASLREALVEMAADQWKVQPAALQAKNGTIIHGASGRELGYGELTRGKKILLPVRDGVVLTPAAEWAVAGTSVAKVNGRDFVTGKHQYTSDLELPGMVYGKVLRAPAYGASLVPVEVEKAQATPGITVVREGDFIGITAPDPQTAANALARIDAQWETSPQPSNAEIFTYLKENARRGDEEGSAPAETRNAFNASAVRLENRVEVQYIAHVPLDPSAAVAHR